MANFNPFNDYLGLPEIVFDTDTKPEPDPSRIHRFSMSSSMDSINSDNSSSVNTANTSSASSQLNQSLEPLPEITTSSPAITYPLATMSPEVPPTVTMSCDDLSFDVSNDIFTKVAVESSFFPSVDETPVEPPAPVGRAIAGRNIVSPPDFSTQKQDAMELEADVCDFYTPFQQNNRPSDFDLSQIVHGMVKNACRFEMMAAADKFSLAKVCVFCQRNGETKEFYSTHVLKDSKGRVICPVLRSYICPSCNATGDKAHTLRHCPLSRNVASMADTFKTRRTSCGFRKFNS